jgi:hypothetical protein
MTRRPDVRIAAPVVAGTAMLLLAACPPHTGAADPCAAPFVPVADWQEVGGRAFTMRLPPGLERVRVQGIDSEVGEWSDTDRRVAYDYGWYSDKLENPPEGARELTRCEVTVAGRPVRIVRFRSRDGKQVVEAHWPAVGAPEEPRGPSNTLTIHTEARAARDAELLLAIVHSVRFRK